MGLVVNEMMKQYPFKLARLDHLVPSYQDYPIIEGIRSVMIITHPVWSHVLAVCPHMRWWEITEIYMFPGFHYWLYHIPSILLKS